jgi:hypothetical protein
VDKVVTEIVADLEMVSPVATPTLDPKVCCPLHAYAHTRTRTLIAIISTLSKEICLIPPYPCEILYMDPSIYQHCDISRRTIGQDAEQRRP